MCLIILVMWACWVMYISVGCTAKVSHVSATPFARMVPVAVPLVFMFVIALGTARFASGGDVDRIRCSIRIHANNMCDSHDCNQRQQVLQQATRHTHDDQLFVCMTICL